MARNLAVAAVSLILMALFRLLWILAKVWCMARLIWRWREIRVGEHLRSAWGIAWLIGVPRTIRRWCKIPISGNLCAIMDSMNQGNCHRDSFRAWVLFSQICVHFSLSHIRA